MARIKVLLIFALEYMKRLSDRSKAGIDSATYNHFHAFISKLDYANEQVQIAKQTSKSVSKTKKTSNGWHQRQKVQAVEILKEKVKARLKMQKLIKLKEQKMFDEIATQQFIRRRQAS